MRRTKEEAARTRAAIVEAALACFDRHGIAGTTMEQIASTARVTKGAVYHPFSCKNEILHELREEVSLPLLDEADTEVLRGTSLAALERIERFPLGVLDTLEGHARTRRALAVMMFKCEYVGELAGELAGACRKSERLAKAFEGAYREAKRNGALAAGVDPAVASVETLMFLNGLGRLWLATGEASALRRKARAAVRAHVRARRKGA